MHRISTFPRLALVGLTLVTLAGCGSGGQVDRVSTSTASTPVIADSAHDGAPDLRSSRPLDGDAVTLVVSGLSCPLCASNVDQQLLRLPGVQGVSVDLAAGRIGVSLQEPRPSPAELTRAIDQSGFTLERIETR